MKRFVIPCILLSALPLAACDSGQGGSFTSAAKLVAGVESDFMIKVTGTPGTKFSGGYLLMKPDGSSTQKTVDGKVPAEFALRGSMVSTSFQKQAQNGQLVVVVLRNGQEASRSDTDAAFGVVSVATQ